MTEMHAYFLRRRAVGITFACDFEFLLPSAFQSAAYQIGFRVAAIQKLASSPWPPSGVTVDEHSCSHRRELELSQES
jgi:hypothetical protein